MRVTLLRGRRRPRGYGDANVAHLLAAQRREGQRKVLLPERRVTATQVSHCRLLQTVAAICIITITSYFSDIGNY